MSTVWQRARRLLRFELGLCLLIGATVGVGVGLNAATFGLVDYLLFRPPAHVGDPAGLVLVRRAENYVEFIRLRDAVPALSLAAYVNKPMATEFGGEPTTSIVSCVTGSFAAVLNTRASVGRWFGAPEEADGAAPTAVISDRLWAQRYGRAESTVGSSLRLGGRLYEIVGVAPAEFRGIELVPIDIWVPMATAADSCTVSGAGLFASNGAAWLSVIGRIDRGTPLSVASAQVADVLRTLRREIRTEPQLEPIRDVRGQSRDGRVSVWLAMASAALLLVATMNVAGLLAIRSLNQRRETEIQLALGASHSMLIRNLVADGVMLALLSSATAVLFFVLASTALGKFFSYSDPYSAFASVGRLGAFLGLVVVTLALATILPARHILRASPADPMRASRVDIGENAWLRTALLMSQVSLAFVFTVGVVFFVKSLGNVRADLGYDMDHAAIASVDPQRLRLTTSEAEETVQAVASRLRKVPEIRHVGLSSGTMLGSEGWSVIVPVRRSVSDSKGIFQAETAVDPAYFAAIGTRILRGRAFLPTDSNGAPPVAVVSQRLASDVWPGEEALGQCLYVANATCLRVVGVSETRRPGAITRTEGELFVPLAQTGAGGPKLIPQLIVVQGNELTAVARAFQAVIADSRLRGTSVQPVRSLVDGQARSWRLGVSVFSWLSVVAVFLTMVGTYASAAFSVSRRTREIGVRMALGATPRAIGWLVIRQTLLPVLGGLAIGFTAVLLGIRAAGGLLFGVGAAQIQAYVPALLAAVLSVAIGALIPAVRAAGVDPLRALSDSRS